VRAAQGQKLRRWLWWTVAYMLVICALGVLDGIVPSAPPAAVHWSE
jgi:hypothetical protein